MKLPRDLRRRGRQTAGPSLGLPRDSEQGQPYDRDADGRRRRASGDRAAASGRADRHVGCDCRRRGGVPRLSPEDVRPHGDAIEQF